MCPAAFRYYLTRRFLQKLFCSHVLEKIPGQHVEHMVNMFLKEFCGLHSGKTFESHWCGGKGFRTSCTTLWHLCWERCRMRWRYKGPEMKAEVVVVTMTWVMITHVMPPNVPPFALVREVSHGVALRPPRDEGRRCCCPYDIRQKHPCNAPPKSIPLHLCSTTRNDRLEIKPEVVVVPMTFVKSTHAMPRKVRPFTFVFYNPERPPGDEGRRSCCSQDESRK